MSDLSIIPDGALLIRDNVIEELGPTRRVENLIPARLAKEIDAAGKIVMPAFVDPDIALAAPASSAAAEGDAPETDIRRVSRTRLEDHAAMTAAELARYGVLTVGANTLFAPDLQNISKALRLHAAIQSKPLRIRSVVSPPAANSGGETWMSSVFQRKLATLLEIPASGESIETCRGIAAAAAAIGYAIRFRVSGPTTLEVLQLAAAAGAVALIGAIPETSQLTRALSDVGCINIALATRILAGNYIPKRNAIDDGVPVALASGYGHGGISSLNPQFLLFLACRNLGLTIEEAIVATTYNAACSLRLSHVTGSLEHGKIADICMMDVNDYRELGRRAGHHDAYLVMRAGKVVYRRQGVIPD